MTVTHLAGARALPSAEGSLEFWLASPTATTLSCTRWSPSGTGEPGAYRRLRARPVPGTVRGLRHVRVEYAARADDWAMISSAQEYVIGEANGFTVAVSLPSGSARLPGTWLERWFQFRFAPTLRPRLLAGLTPEPAAGGLTDLWPLPDVFYPPGTSPERGKAAEAPELAFVTGANPAWTWRRRPWEAVTEEASWDDLTGFEALVALTTDPAAGDVLSWLSRQADLEAGNGRT